MKKTVAFLMVLCLTLMLCACQDGQLPSENTDTKPDSSQPEITAPTQPEITAPTQPTVPTTECAHIFVDATCVEPKTCSLCGMEEGAALGHVYQSATCTSSATCSVCGITNGDANGHDFAAATCTAPASCKNCDYTEGKALNHVYSEATCVSPATCSRCGATSGSVSAHSFQGSSCTVCGYKLRLQQKDVFIRVAPSNGKTAATLTVTNKSSQAITFGTVVVNEGVCSNFTVDGNKTKEVTIRPGETKQVTCWYMFSGENYGAGSCGYVVVKWNNEQYYFEFNTSGVTLFWKGNVNGPVE